MCRKLFFLFSLNLLLFVGPKALSQDANSVIGYNSTVSSDSMGPLDLFARIDYNTARAHAPIAVVMHGYHQDFDDVRINAQRLRDAGFFVISVAMRGRNGSDGMFDSGGVEIYDIYDAVEYVKNNFAAYVDPNNIHITGYSGGGGNVMSALTKFPDYFRVGSAYFGMSDYGYDITDSWYFNGASEAHKNTMRTYIGDPTLGDPNITARYAARASNLASHNNPYSEIHLFVNYNEQVCPVINDTSYRDNAIAHANFPGEFGNITVHIGGRYDGNDHYEDFNWNGVNEPNELQSWPHVNPNADQQHAAEAWYLGRLLDGSIPQPVLNSSDELYVAGYIKTRPFSLWLGDGQNAAGELSYSLSAASKTFELDILTSDQTVTGTLKVQTADMAGHLVAVKVNGIEVEAFEGGGVYVYNGLGHGELLELLSSVIIWYVDDDAQADPGPNDPAVSDPNEDGSSQHPFDTIQEGVDIAVDGEIIIVIEGTYYENINLNGKHITLTSTDPDYPNVIANTIIDGNNTSPVVTFADTEDPNCLLTGFTITHGYVDYQSEGSGISGNGTHATINKCIVSNNGGWDAGSGGGIANCQGAITNCTISGNWSGRDGGGLYDCNGPITNCIINGNTAGQSGGGLHGCNGPITNCTISSNYAEQYGGGLAYCNGPITNCILWDNIADVEGDQLHSCSDPNYSNVQDWTGGGIGNIVDDPCFGDPGYWDPNGTPGEPNDDFWVDGDYHLKSEAGRWDPNGGSWVYDDISSQSIDAGNPDSDYSNEPFPSGSRINIGAYGGTPEASRSPSQLAAKINFQPSGSVIPAGYEADFGDAYGDRGNGLTYGWDGANYNTRERGADPDQQYDTFNHLQKSGSHIWEIELANGTYLVYLVCGEPSYNDQINTIDIEGTVMTDPDGPDNFDEYSVELEVADGRLTIGPAAGASNAKVCFTKIIGQMVLPDTTPPTPDPMTWVTPPYATGDSSIAMVATTASDASGVEYYFAETSGKPGGSDSDWQDSPMYEDTGLDPNTQYSYQVKARDKSLNQNETGWSTEEYATTEPPDTAPPSPDPMSWGTIPYATSSTSIAMVATTASDGSGVEYYFAETSGNPGGSDSGWQDSPMYEDTGLDPDTQYSYQVKARDKSVNHNETGWSTSEPVTTLIAPPPADIKINFQSASSVVPSGYEPDFGDAYGDRGNGLTYGWDGANNNARDRRVDPDQRYDTFNHLQKSGEHTWEIELPDGTYDVYLVCGDPSYNDQKNTIDIEGTMLTDPDGPDYFDEHSVEVEVADGRLTIGPAAGASNSKVCFIEITSVWVLPDTTPPTPDPMTWVTPPYATGDSSIAMAATTASDASGVEYYFEETSGQPGGSDSGWQDSPTYENTGLDPDTQYSYQVKARDKSINQNETGWSTEEYATTEPPDTTPPSPDPMSWGTIPYATSSTSIAMVAATASDGSGVEYYFAETSGQPGGSDSGWQDSPTYEDTGLDPNTQYSYQVKARDKSVNQNETGWSTSEPATTLIVPPPADIKINFQPSGSAVPEGYEPDFGDAYGDRGNGLTYGWDGANYNTRERGVDPDQRYDTLNHLLRSGGFHIWEIELANGTYDVYLVCGDPSYDHQVNTIDIEGMVLTDPDGPDYFDEYSVEVEVADGRLTIKAAAFWSILATDLKFCFIEITGPVALMDTTLPVPDPMTWATVPYATGSSSIFMIATTASDPSGVEYYFKETSGNPGGSDSGWQDSTTYEDTGLEPETQYTYRLKARDKSVNQSETGWSTSESAVPRSALRINFQPDEPWIVVPTGYEPDAGETYGDRGNGLTYGWSTPNNYPNDHIVRFSDPDQRYDTFMHMQKSRDHTWEIELANGTYFVYLVCGDPWYDDQINTVDIEGTVLTDPDGPDYFDEYSVEVEVTDGRLTMRPAAGASNSKVCFIEIADQP